jgi:DNA processing protein
MQTRDLTPDEFPLRLRTIENPPTHLTVCGDLDANKKKVIAFVGARKAEAKSVEFVKELATECAKHGAIIVSGGAVGIDTAAHDAALNAGGRTWSVLGSGINYVFPPKNRDLFAKIAATPGCALVWPFEHDREPLAQNFLARNRILVALADVVVVVQAGIASGSRNSAAIARKTGKPLWVAPGAPWQKNFAGSLLEIELGAKMLISDTQFLVAMFGRDAVTKEAKNEPIVNRSPEETALLEAATERPEHVDELFELAGLSPASAATALLTLALEHVLVEGPPGYYRRG